MSIVLRYWSKIWLLSAGFTNNKHFSVQLYWTCRKMEMQGVALECRSPSWGWIVKYQARVAGGYRFIGLPKWKLRYCWTILLSLKRRAAVSDELVFLASFSPQDTVVDQFSKFKRSQPLLPILQAQPKLLFSSTSFAFFLKNFLCEKHLCCLRGVPTKWPAKKIP